MNTCKNCGKELKSQEEQEVIQAEGRRAGKHWRYYQGAFCDGILTMDTDPYAVEIEDDFSESLDCEGNRFEYAMDI